MIKLKKNRAIPSVLDQQGNCKLSNGTYNMCNNYDMTPNDFDQGTETFTFENNIYASANIKEQLRIDQNGKCAFCEQNIISISYGDVEHFRPKGGYRQNETDDFNRPGYYWLAYDWSNLLLVCQICNQRHKKNYFPVRNPERRALNHHYDIRLEKPFFINPYFENPRQLIGFRKEVAYGKDRRHRGKKTIATIGLNRRSKNGAYKDLLEERRDYLILIATTHKISQKKPGGDLTTNEIVMAADIVKNAKVKTSKFSAMLQENLT
ncbi:MULTISPECIES: HNH endonuclease family protein [Arenibacter]|uniref:hypothetical protein n=1 Tax=Arenibacter TaxID=178469 RepID=UPI00068BA89E|nr:MULTISPECIES: hypothetical protein [Arenibacter]GBF18026.1 hypothetical protein C21_00182 [Arenibacter sp. NBRC 103722]